MLTIAQIQEEILAVLIVINKYILTHQSTWKYMIQDEHYNWTY